MLKDYCYFQNLLFKIKFLLSLIHVFIFRTVIKIKYAELFSAAFYVKIIGKIKKVTRRAAADEILRYVKNCIYLIFLLNNCFLILIFEKPFFLNTRRPDYISYLIFYNYYRFLLRSSRSRSCRFLKTNIILKGKSVWKWRINILIFSAR
jgi:hypothetical protein